MKKRFRVLSIILIAFAFFSCRNLIGDDGSDSETVSSDSNVSAKIYSIQGYISQEDFIDSASRTAFPAQPLGTVYYRITAKCGAETVTSEKNSTDSNFTLKIPHAGNWTVWAEGFKETTHTNLLLKTSENKILQISDDAPMGYANLVLKPYVSENGTGKINLSITIPTAVSTVAVNCISGNKDSFTGVNVGISGSAVTIGDDTNNIKSGSYTVEISFKGTVSGVDNVLLYHVTEVINVYDNLTTNTWVKHGDEPYINAAGNFEITDAMTQEFLLTTVYVDSTVADSGDGTYFEPVKTLGEAFEKFVDSSKNYTINIMGDVEVNADDEIILLNNTTFQKAPGVPSATIKYRPTTVKRLFTINPSVTVRISGINIEGPDTASSSSGAAIFNHGQLYLTNVNLSKFKSSSNGGCLANDGDGNIFITGGSIKGCEGSNGGAIYNEGKDIKIKDCTINKCTAASGGAIYNFSDNVRITLEGNTVIGEDKGVNATNANYGNHASSSGGAIYMSRGNLYLTENTVIAKNYSAGNGGGLYLASGTKVYLQDSASIKNCTAATNGSGIYVSAAACRVYMKDSAYLDPASDVWLNGNACVTLNGNLTPPAAANGIAATLTPQFYDPDDDPGLGSYIQLLNSEPSGFVAGNYSRFKVKEKRSGEYVIPYTINAEGKLTGISQASLEGLVSSFDSSNKYLITISDPNPDFTTLYNALKNSRAQFKLDLSQTTITTLASGSLHDMNKMTDVSFPSTLTTLEAGSIYSLSSSLTIKIPASVTTITGNPFAKVTASISSLSVSDTSCNITLEEGNSNYKMIDGVIYTKDGKRLVCYPKSKTNTTFTIPDGVEVIGSGAFAGNSKLTEVIFNDGLKTIEESAFAKLTKNKKVVLPSSVTTIGDYSFSRNYVLEILTITGGQPYTIGEGAFAYLGIPAQGAIKDCKVTIGEGVSEIGNDAFGMCNIDSSTEAPLVLPASLTKIGSYNFDRGKVKFIKSLAVVPPEVGSSSLYSTGIQIIYVPSSSVDAYKAANKWRDYSIVGF